MATAETAVTLEMAAREAGVSSSTVSRILNGTARVRESKARSVHTAIAKRRFLPNPVAQSLARGKSMRVGVVSQTLASPCYGEALAAIESGLFRANYSPLFVSGHWREADERRCVEHLLSRRVDGGRSVSLDYDNTQSARVANDQSAYGAMLALHRRGIGVPKDVSVVGFDDLAGSAFTTPPLTTMHRSIDEIGHCAAAAMIDLIEGRAPTIRISSPTLSIRESTRPIQF